MAGVGDRLDTLQGRWVQGAGLLLVIGASALAFALAAAGILWLVSLAAVALGATASSFDSYWFMRWMIYTSALWLPLSVGMVAKGLNRLSAPAND